MSQTSELLSKRIATGLYLLKYAKMVKFWAGLCSCASSSWLQSGPADRWHVPACVQWSNVLDGTAVRFSTSNSPTVCAWRETDIFVKSGFSNDSNHSNTVFFLGHWPSMVLRQLVAVSLAMSDLAHARVPGLSHLQYLAIHLHCNK